MAQEPTPADDPVSSTSEPATSEASDQLATPAGDIEALAADCVFIQWCDQPNSSNGTVRRPQQRGLAGALHRSDDPR
jgi:hypothetical protein